MAEITITSENFTQEVLQSDIPVLLDFWATWCGPCGMIAPIVAEIAEEKAGSLKVGKVDVDQEFALAGQFGITAIPTLLVFRGGKVSAQLVGYRSKQEILSALGL